MAEHFARLVAPLEPEVFWNRYWGKAHLHLRRAAGELHESVVRTKDLDILLQSGLLPAAFVNVVSGGVLHPVEEWSQVRDSARGSERVIRTERLLELYSKGATIILNQAHQAIPRLSSFCRELAAELGIATQANIYIGPPAARGFTLHTDDHEVFVLQLQGAKSWRIVPGGEAPSVEVELLAGDLLYIPRGLAHEAMSRDASSIHLTLGLKPVYGFHLLEELAAMARSHPDFQQPLAPGEAPEAAAFSHKVAALLAATPAAELHKRLSRTLIDEQIQGWPGRLTDMLALRCLTLETVVCGRAGIIQQTARTGKTITMEFAGQKLSVPVFLQSCLDRILSGQPFAIGELQGMITDSGRIELVKRFVQSGYLAVVHP